ncbi:MAG: MerR family transcriptional regulator [Chloroflexi bacterium]|nr:MerR family transcriptional regulator [Chloroflexota bacterium]
MRNSSNLLKIGELAKRANTTTKTIRYYERIGLLSPAKRGANRYRLYAPEALGRVRFIRRAKQMGLTLDDVMGLVVIAQEGTSTALRNQLKEIIARKIIETDAQLKSLTLFRQDLEALAATLSETSLEQCTTCGAFLANCDCTDSDKNGDEDK